MKLNTAVGILGAAIVEEHFTTFMLSSPATTRNLYGSNPTALEGIKTDLWISLGVDIGLGVLMAGLFDSIEAGLFGFFFALGLYLIYKVRAGL